jgi:hypothetical protein
MKRQTYKLEPGDRIRDTHGARRVVRVDYDDTREPGMRTVVFADEHPNADCHYKHEWEVLP